MPQLIGSIFCWYATIPENSFFGMPLKANFPFDGMLKKEISCPFVSISTVLKLRIPGLRACPSMWDSTVIKSISTLGMIYFKSILILNAVRYFILHFESVNLWILAENKLLPAPSDREGLGLKLYRKTASYADRIIGWSDKFRSLSVL